MVHLWIGKEGTTAGQNNKLIYDYLLQAIHGATYNRSGSLLGDIIRNTLHVLKQRNYFKSISDISLYKTKSKTKSGVAMFGQGRRTKLEGKEGAFNVQKLQLAPDEVVIAGKTLTFTQPGEFIPMVDVHFAAHGMTVVVDLPGIPKKSELEVWDYKVVNEDGKKEGDKRCEVVMPKLDPATDELVIKGTRLLYVPELIVSEKGQYEFPRDWANRVNCYKRDSETYTINMARRGGDYEYRVKVPTNYKRDQKAIVADLKFGVLHVFIPALQEAQNK